MRPYALIATTAVSGALLTLQRRRFGAAKRLAAAGLETLLNAVEANDPDTGQHLRRVGRYARILATYAGLDERDVNGVERVGLFHDIGKIHAALHDVLHDDDQVLTAAEREAIASHPQRGAAVLKPYAPFYPELPAGVLAHHERWDGTGYPRGLRGRRIPFTSRIVSLADTFDVIANGRTYRRAGGAIAAAFEIARERGTQFDPELVDLLLFPPVLLHLARTHVAVYKDENRRKQKDRERYVPDVRFRWRGALKPMEIRRVAN